MSKCTDCLSEKVCRYNDEHNLYYLYCKNDYVCPYFTDRSEWVHLPCNVGDILYFVKNNTDACCPVCDTYDGYDNYCYLKQKCYPELAEIPICDKQFMEIVKCKGDLVTIVKNMDKFGKTVFLAHDEAEKALEEKRSIRNNE
nr:MAG TPA: hypothetical protein [Caudoviricetes sp.]